MSDQEIATPIAEAVTQESAPVEAPVASEEPAGEVEIPTQTTEAEGSEPSKAVKELITQRKRRQDAERVAAEKTAEAAYYRGIAEGKGFKPEVTQTQNPVANPALVPPNSDDFELWSDFEKAKDRYIVALTKEEIRRENEQRIVVQEQQKVTQTFRQRIDKAAEEDPTILDIVQDKTLPLHKAALPLVYESEVAPQLLQYLNKNREEAKKIHILFDTNPVLAAREITKIEAKIASAPKPEAPKKVSLAPEPIKTVAGNNGGSTVDEDKLPMDEWVKRRNAPLLKRRK